MQNELSHTGPLRRSPLYLYPDRHRASWKGREVSLTLREYAIVEQLAQQFHHCPPGCETASRPAADAPWPMANPSPWKAATGTSAGKRCCFAAP